MFLDRDGVINVRLIDDYVKNREAFVFLPNVRESCAVFSDFFDRIFVVTNQQGVGKGLMSMEQVNDIHQFMVEEIEKVGGRIDQVYVAPYLQSDNNIMRKPSPGMALKAKKEFSEVQFKQSVMVGDSISDMQFGKRLGMVTIFLGNDVNQCRDNNELIDYSFSDLWSFAQTLLTI